MILSERPLLTDSAEAIAALLNSLPPLGHVGHACSNPRCWQCRQRLEQYAAEKRAHAVLARLYVVLGIPADPEERRIP